MFLCDGSFCAELISKDSMPRQFLQFHTCDRKKQKLTNFLKQKDFEELLKERNVIENLNALEDLIADAQRRRARAVQGEAPPIPYVTSVSFLLTAMPLSPSPPSSLPPISRSFPPLIYYSTSPRPTLSSCPIHSINHICLSPLPSILLFPFSFLSLPSPLRRLPYHLPKSPTHTPLTHPTIDHTHSPPPPSSPHTSNPTSQPSNPH